MDKSLSIHNDVLIYTDENHRYTLNDAVVPSVTTLVKGSLPVSQYLIDWQIGKGVSFLLDTLDCPPSVLALEERIKLEKEAKYAYKRELKAAGDIGTQLHNFAHVYKQGLSWKEEYDKMCEKAKECADKFMEWDENSEGEVVGLEQAVGSTLWKFAGRFDRLDKTDKGIKIMDYKTTGAVRMEHFIQMALYGIALSEWMGVQAEWLEVVRMGKDGSFEVQTVPFTRELSEQAIRCVLTYNFIKGWNDVKRSEPIITEGSKHNSSLGERGKRRGTKQTTSN